LIVAISSLSGAQRDASPGGSSLRGDARIGFLPARDDPQGAVV